MKLSIFNFQFSALIAFLLICGSTTASTLTLSKDANISILTCAPGSELYSLFGHTAIRIEDQTAGIDVVFNYGTFDFRTKHFYLKYAQGLLPYQLSYASYTNFVNEYIYTNRSVYSQLLHLDSTGKQKLLDLLLINYQPENRSYLYNFLFDNCSTRVRDIIEESIPGRIVWKARDTDKSFWNLLDEYLYVSPWIKWGIHTILGQPGSKTASPRQYMFLPDYLMNGLDSAYEGNSKLTSPIEVVYQSTESVTPTPWYKGPLFIFSVCLLALVVLLQKVRSRKLLNTVTILFFMVSGLIGVLLIFLGFFTEHPITAPNLNLIWANPLNLIALCFIGKKQIPWLIQKYLIVYLVILSAGIPVWFFALPAVPFASLPIIIFMGYLSFKLKYIKV